MVRTGKAGRPKGTKQHDYRRQLRTAADIKVNNPETSDRKAFVKAIEKHGKVGLSEDANLKALQRQWRKTEEREKYLDEARERQMESRQTRVVSRSLADAFRLPLSNTLAINAHNELRQHIQREIEPMFELRRIANQMQELERITNPLGSALEAIEREQALIRNITRTGLV